LNRLSRNKQHTARPVALFSGITIAKHRGFKSGSPLEEGWMSQMEQEMEQDLSARIRERAYEIWIASGYRDGEAKQHWLAAERGNLIGSAIRSRGKGSCKVGQRPYDQTISCSPSV
jgi:Protein of unknown function (DUF2934)